MRISRLAAGLVTVGLIGFAPVAITSPATAAGTETPVATVTSYDTDGIFEYGDDLNLSASVKSASGSSVFTGTYALQVSTPATPAFTTVATGTASGFISFDITATTNAVYQLVYSGGTSGSGSSATTYTATTSAPFTVRTTRKLSLKTNRLKVIGKVTPDYGKKKIKVLRKDGKKFKKYASVKTNKKGKFTFNAPRRNKFKFILVVPGDATFTASPSVVYTVRVY